MVLAMRKAAAAAIPPTKRVCRALRTGAEPANPAVTTIRVAIAGPDSPAAREKGTVNPSAMPMTMSRTVSLAVKWCSMWRVCGMGDRKSVV